MKTLLFTVVALLAVTGASMASEQNRDGQPQPKQTQTEQAQAVPSDASGSIRGDAWMSSNCLPDPCQPLALKSTPGDSEGDPGAPQNQVEYGGGG